jgi:MoaA/NifB/PqqE/SkfB family radical SAM enzyme
MLENKRNPSCEQNCWHAEDIGAVSPRMYQCGQAKTHTDAITDPEVIDLTLSLDCNLTCTYCCKEYSSAWQRDVLNNGDYAILGDRYRANTKDRVLQKIKQPDLLLSQNFNFLLEEVSRISSNLKKIIITGGEPFLNNSLINFVSKLTHVPVIEIYTGLGVDPTRFSRILDKLKQFDNVRIIVSAENIDSLLEFNRYGVSWKDFKTCIDIIKEHKIKFHFQSTITNLTIFGFLDFYKYFKDEDIQLTFAYSPRMMSLHVLDNSSKQLITNQLSELPDKFKLMIEPSMQSDYVEQDRTDLRTFLSEFTLRREGLNLSVFPTTFLNWLELNVV